MTLRILLLVLAIWRPLHNKTLMCESISVNTRLRGVPVQRNLHIYPLTCLLQELARFRVQDAEDTVGHCENNSLHLYICCNITGTSEFN